MSNTIPLPPPMSEADEKRLNAALTIVFDLACGPADPTMMQDELVAAAESIGMRFPAPAVPDLKHKPTVQRLMDLARKFRSAPGDLYDGAYKELQSACYEALSAAPAVREPLIDEMDAVASRYAHKLALDLECVLSDYNGRWWDAAMNTIGGYRMAMNAIHERESPTHMGEPVLPKHGIAAPGGKHV